MSGFVWEKNFLRIFYALITGNEKPQKASLNTVDIIELFCGNVE